MVKIDRSLVQAEEGKLTPEEHKLLRLQLLYRDFDEKRESATAKLQVSAEYRNACTILTTDTCIVVPKYFRNLF